jgi:hypothetical protein
MAASICATLLSASADWYRVSARYLKVCSMLQGAATGFAAGPDSLLMRVQGASLGFAILVLGEFPSRAKADADDSGEGSDNPSSLSSAWASTSSVPVSSGCRFLPRTCLPGVHPPLPCPVPGTISPRSERRLPPASTFWCP